MTYATTCKNATNACPLTFAGQSFLLDPSGALYWPAQRMLIVADLHLEKASFLAHAGSALPGYDTRDTLTRLHALITAYQPAEMLCLGDSFHDPTAAVRMRAADKIALFDLVHRVGEWHWLLGNHDPALPAFLPGACCNRMERARITFTHEILPQTLPQMCGHYHPKFRRKLHGHSVSGRCLMHDAARMILPAFGSFTGGLAHDAPALTTLLHAPSIYLLHRQQVWKVQADPLRR